MKSKRLGQFHVTPELLEDGNRDMLKQFFANMIVYQAQFDYRMRAVTYIAESDLFDPVPEGCVAPDYEMMCHRDYATGIITITAEKKKYQTEQPAAPLITSFHQKLSNLKNAINAFLP